MKYSIIYADPPWDYCGNKMSSGSSAAGHYNTMKLPELKALKVAHICEDDALIFMWTSSPHLEQALELMRAWSFKFATVGFVWEKQRKNPGFYTMSQCEMCLIGKRGKIPSPRGSRNVPQFHSELRGQHSAKPAIIRDRIDAMFPTQMKLEMFARTSTPGWDVFGNEVSSSIAILG